MITETTFSGITAVWGSQEMRQITWRGLEAYLFYLMALFNILARWNSRNWTKTDTSIAQSLTSPSDIN